MFYLGASLSGILVDDKGGDLWVGRRRWSDSMYGGGLVDGGDVFLGVTNGGCLVSLSDGGLGFLGGVDSLSLLEELVRHGTVGNGGIVLGDAGVSGIKHC